MDFEAELAAARDLDVSVLADSIESIGFECTRCGACCKGHDGDHTATVFPGEIREIRNGEYDWRDVARPMPFGLEGGGDGAEGETFEWALQTDSCGDCTFYDDGTGDEPGACTVHTDRPLICQTYPFSVGDLNENGENDGHGPTDSEDGGLGTTEPMGGVVDRDGMVRAHECEGLGRDISREDAVELAEALKERAVRELREAIGVRDNHDRVDADGIVVHDSEGQKRPDGTPVENSSTY
jgi:Fe-S-cluster containining protein